ncbi:MAG: helix-turn-helix transcriptional regulator, partial [Candidatus Krumholzibacteria bacterium]|nr:helix-turn-helix transcriptional regulator [Candidatus Krumholzibacteria bacterium]
MGIAERREREKEQRRIDIIDAAERVFFSKGWQAATMDDVAEAVELSKATLYLYFKNKEEL